VQLELESRMREPPTDTAVVNAIGHKSIKVTAVPQEEIHSCDSATISGSWIECGTGDQKLAARQEISYTGTIDLEDGASRRARISILFAE
jgi:hypothetical protein